VAKFGGNVPGVGVNASAPAPAPGPPPVVWRVDTALVAPARLRDTRDVKALETDGHAAAVRHQKDHAGRVERWETPTGKHLKRRLRKRPGVRLGDRVYRCPLHVHQPDEAGVEFIRAALAHGRAAVLRLDLACDIPCESQQAADALHAELRERVFLVGARGRVRVSHATGTTPGTTYLGASKHEETAKQGEGAVVVIYSDEHAAKKNGGRPTCHVELRLFGARVVRAAVGRALSLERAWRRVRVVDDLSRAGYGVRRLASRGGGIPYAQDVHDEMRLLGFDRRPVFARAVPFRRWASGSPRRSFARHVDSRAVAVGDARTTPFPEPPRGVEFPHTRYDRTSVGSTPPATPTRSSSSTPTPRLRFLPHQTRHRFRYRPSRPPSNPDKESTP
jgi:hypothetical protein